MADVWALARRRALVVACAAGAIATYLVTWHVWSPRTAVPTLPLISALGGVPFGAALIVSALISVVRPRVGAVIHTLLLGAAVLGDQIRLQPEFISLGILLLAAGWATDRTDADPGSRSRALDVARWHLGTLWIWAGIHKLLSRGWETGGATFLASLLGHPSLGRAIAIGAPLTEIGLGLAALNPRTWPVVRWVALVFHLAIFATLLKGDWNSAVWPWNVALGVAAWLLFAPRPRVTTGVPTPIGQRRPHAATLLGVLFAVYPVGFYLGLTDAYLAHNLYSSNTAVGYVCVSSGQSCSLSPFSSTWSALNVPLPPEPRLYRAWFAKVCAPGEQLRIDAISTRLTDPGSTVTTCART